MATPQTSIQLIVFGSRTEDDFDGVLRDVAQAGFDNIEAGNLFAMLGEHNTRQLLDAHKIGVSGAHFGYGDYADPERLKANIAYAQAIGLQNLMCSGVSDGKTVEGYRQSAQVFNEAGKQIRDAGMAFNYHNHAWEFDDLGGGTNGMQILDEQTDPALVKYNLDVFWIHYAGLDPTQFIGAHRDRTGYFHFKDGRKRPTADGKTHPLFTELGRGDVDLKAAYQAALAANATWIVSEQDNTETTPQESARISREYLRDALGL